MTPAPDRVTLDLVDADSTLAAGRALASALRPGMLVTLSGDLGAGKTTLVRGVLAGLDWTGPVKSPTYALVEHYPLSNLYLYHFDFYRFNDEREWDDAGLAEAFGDAATCIVEWPERAANRLPLPDCAIALEFQGAHGVARRLVAVAHSEDGRRCLDALRTVQSR